MLSGSPFPSELANAWERRVPSGWVVENEGVPPDVEVEQWPAGLNAGRDPQLEKAIEIVLKELKMSPPARPQRPPDPRPRLRPGVG